MPDTLTVKGLNVRAGATPLLTDVSLSLTSGRVTALVGTSGSGKSVLITALLGLLPPPLTVTMRSYTLAIGTQHLAPLRGGYRVLRRGAVAWMPQDARAALDPLRTVGAQVGLAAKRRGHTGGAGPWLRAAGLDQPDRVAALLPDALSGGMAQRALLAIALACDACFLLADEPTTALDPVHARAVLDRLRAVARQDNVGVLLVTHDLRVLPEVADEIVVLDQGRIVEHLPTGDAGALVSPAGLWLRQATGRVTGAHRP